MVHLYCYICVLLGLFIIAACRPRSPYKRRHSTWVWPQTTSLCRLRSSASQGPPLLSPTPARCSPVCLFIFLHLFCTTTNCQHFLSISWGIINIYYIVQIEIYFFPDFLPEPNYLKRLLGLHSSARMPRIQHLWLQWAEEKKTEKMKSWKKVLQTWPPFMWFKSPTLYIFRTL